MKKETLDTTGYIIVEGEVIEMTFKSYLNEYDNSEMKMWVAPVDPFDGEEVSGKFEICAQKINRAAERCTNLGQFDSEEEAENEIYERQFWYINEKNWNAPAFFLKIEDAENELIEFMSESMQIDKDVAASIYSKQKRVDAARAIKDAEHRAKVDKEYAERKAWLAIEVPKEAEAITIDQQFKEDIAAAMLLSSKEKSKACEHSLSSLLNRTGRKITTDFWQVLRILKAKAI
mgnify:CR=1 FL=1